MAKATTTKPRTTTKRTTKSTASSAAKSAARTTKAAATKPAAAKPAAKPETESPAAAKPEAAAGDDNTLRRIDLLERVAEITGKRKNQIRDTVDATLMVLGEALSQERDAAVRPLGKITVKQLDDGENGTVVRARIKLQPEEQATGAEADAEGDAPEDGEE